MSENEKKCKDCINCDVCLNIDRLILFDKNQPAHCKAFKDKSLFVELPCKAGDTVYWIDKETGKIVSAILQEFRMGFCVMTEYGSRGYIPHTSFNDNVFYAKEEAERKLREVGE